MTDDQVERSKLYAGRRLCRGQSREMFLASLPLILRLRARCALIERPVQRNRMRHHDHHRNPSSAVSRRTVTVTVRSKLSERSAVKQNGCWRSTIHPAYCSIHVYVGANVRDEQRDVTLSEFEVVGRMCRISRDLLFLFQFAMVKNTTDATI